jgi:hypothetical protein
MTQRFEGAVTTPDDEIPDPTVVPEPERQPRPVLVELASAILIVGGITGLVGWLGAQLVGAGAPASAGLLPLVFVALNVVQIVTGVAIRRGRYWRICINVVAVAVFLYLTAIPNPIAMFYAALGTVVLYALFHHRQWFDSKPAADSDVR